MANELIFEKIQNIIADIADLSKEEILPNCKMIYDIGLTSMEIMNLVSTVEKEFSIKIPEKLLRTFVTAQDVVDCVAAKLEEKFSS